MQKFQLSYREVICRQTLPDTWREITLNTGGTQSTLQDIKISEKANGYCYTDATKHCTRNRFIYWHTNHDVLELVEQSLDVNLSGNRIRYRFVDTPILDGISIHETRNSVVILVPTVCSVHRLVFPHPSVLHKQDEFIGSHPDLTVISIFANATVSNVKDARSFYVFVNPVTSNVHLPHAAASILTPDEDAIFVLAYPSSDILLVQQSIDGSVHCTELKYDSIMPRFIAGIAEKFRSKSSDGNVVVSLILHTTGLETYVIALCRDGHLRVWSATKGQCIAVSNILAETGDSGRQLVQGTQSHLLRKAVGDSGSDILLAVFLCFSTDCQFHILHPVFKDSQFHITRISSLYAPDGDLVDFVTTSTRIWSVWRVEGECQVYSALLSTGSSEGSHWMPVILEPLPEANQPPEDTLDKDPRQLYLQHIFHPGNFPLHVIQKALSIYKRSTLLSDVNMSVSILKQRVCMAVENEIQLKLKESEVSDEDYLECANWCWLRFYSCCVQYYVADLKPLGLLILPSVSGAVLLKKSMYSILRPLDALEHLLLCSDYACREQFLEHPSLSEDMKTTEDVIKLMHTLVYLEQQISELFAQVFEKELSQLKSPDVIMTELLNKVKTEMGFKFAEHICEMLNSCEDLYQAMHKLLELLRIDYVSVVEENDEISFETSQSLNHLFASQLGISFVSQCLRQQAVVRFTICRNLLIVQNIRLQQADWNAMEEAIRSVCSLETVVLTQASYVFMWLTSLPSLPYLPLESTIQRLTPLKLTPVYNLRMTNLQSISLIELFAGSTGGSIAHKMLHKEYKTEDELAFPHWDFSLLRYVMLLSRLIWPVSNNSILSEWLLSSGQHLWLQQHVKLLSNWCEWNSCTRNFLLAASLLGDCEFYKAESLFLMAMKGIYTDQFLAERVQGDTNMNLPHRAVVLYYLKVIQLFELHNARDCAINVANTALSIADQQDPHRATLYSIKFKHHLALKHYDMAFDSLNSNPDNNRKSDNLRDLVKTLLDQKKLNVLLKYSYGNMEEQFRDILFTRARATDAINNVYYDFLYSYQINRGPLFMRLAASVMYEQAFRLSQLNTMEALEKQVKCYLAAKNALYLCDSKFAWVVRPVASDLVQEEVILPTRAGSKENAQVFHVQKQVEVVTMQMLQKELIFALARLQLAKYETQFLTSHLTDPTELVMLLSTTGLFKMALNLCTVFELQYGPVFELLTGRCVVLMYRDDPNAWDWLMENDIHDLTVTRSSPSEMAWKLLETYLRRYEEPNLTELHKAICRKLIKMKCYLPQWLYISYKKRNAGELLRLLHESGRLDEAVQLAKDYILAAMGHGKEQFGFVQSMTPTGPPFCLPVYQIQSLVEELHYQNKKEHEKPFGMEYTMLKELFEKYLQESARISSEMCRYKLTNVK